MKISLPAALAASLAVLLLVPSQASAQDAPATPAAERTEPSLSLAVGGLRLEGGRRAAPPGRQLRFRVRSSAAMAGREVRVRVLRGGRRAEERDVRLRSARGGSEALLRFTPRAEGRYSVSAVIAASPENLRASVRRRFSLRFPSVRRGSRSAAVRDLQRLLLRRGYAVGTGGRFDAGTGRALLAFRKVNGMARNQAAGRAVWRRLVSGGAFRPRFRGTGEARRVEVDRRRQVMALIRNDRVFRVYHVSTGKPSTPTILGRYRMYRKEPGVNNVGMIHSVYFRGGYALHGYPSVPNYPASAGCVRVPPANARAIYDWLRIGDRIDVYHGGGARPSRSETWANPRLRVSIDEMKAREAR